MITVYLLILGDCDNKLVFTINALQYTLDAYFYFKK